MQGSPVLFQVISHLVIRSVGWVTPGTTQCVWGVSWEKPYILHTKLVPIINRPHHAILTQPTLSQAYHIPMQDQQENALWRSNSH